MATEEDKVNSGALATLVAVSTFAMIGVTLAVTALTRDELGIAQSEREDRGSNEVRELQRQQTAKLQAGVPIEEAMKRVVARLSGDPSSATPPGPPVMVPGTAGAGGASATAAAATGAGASAGGASATAAAATGAGASAGGAAVGGAGTPATTVTGSGAGAGGRGAAGAGSSGASPEKNLEKSPGAAAQSAPGSLKPPGAPALSANPAKAPTPAAVPAPPEPGSAPSPGN